MNISGYGAYTPTSREGLSALVDFKGAKKFQKVAREVLSEKSLAVEIFESEKEVLSHLSDKFDLVQDKMIHFGGSVLRNVMTDPAKMETLQSAVDKVERKFQQAENLAVASGKSLTYFSAEVNLAEKTDQFSLQVETWSRQEVEHGGRDRFRAFKIEDFLNRKNSEQSVEISLDELKKEAKKSFEMNVTPKNNMEYQVELYEKTSVSNFFSYT